MNAFAVGASLRERSPAEKALLLCAIAAVASSLLSITFIEGFWILALIPWIILLARRKRRFAPPAFFWPLAVYAGWSLLASAFSVNPGASFSASRKLLVILIVAVIPAAFEKIFDPVVASWALFASGVAASAWAIIYEIFRAAPGERIRGFMGHYMTQAGLLCLFLAFVLAMAVFSRGGVRLIWAATLVPAGAALIMTLTRNAWLGLAAAVLILALWKPRTLIFIPLLAALLYGIGPAPVRSRLRSILDRGDPSNAARIEYARAGLKIIGERPLFGTGPNTVHVVFQDPKYGLGDYARHNVHLHSNIFQIAAERGLPALAAWFIFLGWACVSLGKRFRAAGPRGKPLAAAGLAAVAALVVAGIFEYNFGDSEIALLFFLILALPFAGGTDSRA